MLPDRSPKPSKCATFQLGVKGMASPSQWARMKLLTAWLLVVFVVCLQACSEAVDPARVEALHWEVGLAQKVAELSSAFRDPTGADAVAIKQQHAHCWDQQDESRDCQYWRVLEEHFFRRPHSTRPCWPIVRRTEGFAWSCNSVLPVNPWVESSI